MQRSANKREALSKALLFLLVFKSGAKPWQFKSCTHELGPCQTAQKKKEMIPQHSIACTLFTLSWTISVGSS
eukprot:scaffold161954_cov23-Tisochrysis_lutea.AAC.1